MVHGNFHEGKFMPTSVRVACVGIFRVRSRVGGTLLLWQTAEVKINYFICHNVYLIGWYSIISLFSRFVDPKSERSNIGRDCEGRVYWVGGGEYTRETLFENNNRAMCDNWSEIFSACYSLSLSLSLYLLHSLFVAPPFPSALYSLPYLCNKIVQIQF